MSYDEFDEKYEGSKQLASVNTPSEEQYKCVLPEIELSQNKQVIKDYSGSTPLQLLKPLFNGQIHYQIDGFWAFEFSLGKHIRQYHKENNEVTLEYYLGFASLLNENEPETDYLNLPKIKYKDNEVPYFSLEYSNGTICDLDNRPRSTKIMFVCADKGTSNSFVSITESQTCHYELLFATNRLCFHPAFQRPKTEPFEIKCFLDNSIDIDNRELARPDLYSQFNNDNKFSDFMSVLNKRAGLHNLRPISRHVTPFKPAIKSGPKSHPRNNKNLLPKQTPEEIKKLQQNYRLKEFERLKLVIDEKQAEKSMAQLTNEFFEMEYCFVGKSNTGYKIKVCNRGKITMYEEDEQTGKPGNEILIGKFSDNLQRSLYKADHSHIKSYDEDGSVEQVVHLFHYGSKNIKSGKENYAELRLICNLETDLFTALEITMFIAEKSPGVFDIYLESGLFCSYLQKTDKYGIYFTQIDNDLREILKTLGGINLNDDMELFKITDSDMKPGDKSSFLDALADPDFYETFRFFDDEEKNEEPKKSEPSDNESIDNNKKKKVEL